MPKLVLSSCLALFCALLFALSPGFVKAALAEDAKAANNAKAAEDESPKANKPHIIITGSTGSGAKISPAMLAAVEQYVQREAKTLGGSEYPGERYIAFGPLSSCPSGSCLVVLYLLDEVPGRSSTNYIQCLAAFTLIDGAPQFLAGCQVGGKGLRFLRFKSMGPEAIKFTSEFPLAKDTGDKRSGRADCSFVLASRHLIELPMGHIK